MDPDCKSAFDISNDLLEKTGKALMTGDFQTFSTCFTLPHDLETYSGRRSIKTEEELRAVFDAVRSYTKKDNVTELIRTCVEAEFRDSDTVAATHMAYAVSGSTLAKTPYPAFSILKRIKWEWKVTYSQYAVGDERHSIALLGDGKTDAEE